MEEGPALVLSVVPHGTVGVAWHCLAASRISEASVTLVEGKRRDTAVTRLPTSLVRAPAPTESKGLEKRPNSFDRRVFKDPLLYARLGIVLWAALDAVLACNATSAVTVFWISRRSLAGKTESCETHDEEGVEEDATDACCIFSLEYQGRVMGLGVGVDSLCAKDEWD